MRRDFSVELISLFFDRALPSRTGRLRQLLWDLCFTQMSLAMLKLFGPPLHDKVRNANVRGGSLKDARIHSVYFPYDDAGIRAVNANKLKSLALPRGLEPLFSP
jgi:hypothetical protein